jgi:hypothetical protein
MSARSHHKMVEMLRRAGYSQPTRTADRLKSEGMSPSELAWRLQTGQSLQKTSKNPLSGTDILLALGGIAAVGFVGYLIWNQQQAQAQQAVGPAPASSPTVSYAATTLTQVPAPVPLPNPNAAQGAPPLLVAPAA